MAFKKGKSGNPFGRPKEAANKIGKPLRELIDSFLENNFKKIVKDLSQMEPKDGVKAYCDLLQFTLPKMRSVEMDAEIGSKDPNTVLIGKLKISSE